MLLEKRRTEKKGKKKISREGSKNNPGVYDSGEMLDVNQNDRHAISMNEQTICVVDAPILSSTSSATPKNRKWGKRKEKKRRKNMLKMLFLVFQFISTG